MALNGFVTSSVYHALLGCLCGAVGFRFGWRTGSPGLLPAVQGLLGFVAFAGVWRIGGAVAAGIAVGGWAVGGTLVSVATFMQRPALADARVLQARSYRAEMVAWLRTGRGPEARPIHTAVAHLRELILYVVAAVATANLLGLVLGAVLLNKMNAYVARLLTAARRPAVVALLAWNVWSIVRVAAYIVVGSACAAPVARVLGRPADPTEVRMMLTLGGAGLVLDLLLKLALSRPCGRSLAAALHLDRIDAGETPPQPPPPTGDLV